jgi:hypothetical protein
MGAEIQHAVRLIELATIIAPSLALFVTLAKIALKGF